jgi:hypothetical protein
VSSQARHPVADEAARDPAERRNGARATRRDRGERSRGAATGAPDARRRPRRSARWFGTRTAFDAAACAVYLAFAAWVFHGLWADPATRAIADNRDDQALIEWFLAHGVLLWTGDFSLVTDRLNAPEGVNLMSNASHILHGALVAPVTVLFGAPVSFAVLAAVNLGATAAGWYLLLARGLRLHRGAAAVAGAFAGFAPGMIGQSNSHLHMTAQWLVPPIVWCVIRLTRTPTMRSAVSTGVGLAALVCAQVFLGEEVLYLAVLTLGLFGAVYAARHREWARRVAPRFLSGIAVAVGISVVLLAYPLWIQFQGPQHTPNAPFRAEHYYADIAGYAVFSPLSIAGSEEAGRLATSPSEYNTFLGLPLIAVVVGCLIWLRRAPIAVPAAITAVVMTLLSFGPHITVDGERTGWPSLYGIINGAPVISGALPTRYALALIPLIAVVLAYALDAAARAGGFVRIAVPVAAAAALIPTIPLPMATTDRQPVPEFIATGAWRQCAPEGGVIVPVPVPNPRQPDLMRWPAAANARFGIPEGFFIGPYGAGGRSSLGTYPKPTSRLLSEVGDTGVVPAVTDEMRAQAQKDLAFWRADCVALSQVANEPALKAVLEGLLGPGTAIEDAWTWKVAR